MNTEDSAQNSNGSVRQRERRTGSAELQGWVVLVVDDQVDNLRVAEATLRFYGASVITASNGVNGLEVFDQHPEITLILLDLSMPEMNGWTMFEKLREKPAAKNIPVIALTAHAMEGDEEKVMQAGFTGYIPKPFSVPNLVASIIAILAPKTADTKPLPLEAASQPIHAAEKKTS